MPQYIVYESVLVPSKSKGQFPEAIYTYIANDSAIGWHYTFTHNREQAYIFDDFQLEQSKGIAEMWRMQVKQLN